MPKKAFVTVLFLFNGHSERKFLLCGKCLHALLFGACNVPSVASYDGGTVVVNFKHEAFGFFFGFVEDVHQHHDDKLHGGNIVIVHDDLVALNVVVDAGEALSEVRGVLLLFHASDFEMDKGKKSSTIW